MKIDSSDWKHFYRSLHHGSCILILGPHIATYQSEDGVAELEAAFSTYLAQALKNKGIEFDPELSSNLPYISLRWIKGQKKTDNMLQEEMCDFYNSRATRPPAIYKNLAKLPFFLVINASPEEYMSQAFLRAGKEAQQLHYNYQLNNTSLIPDFNTEKPVVFNLFGLTEKPASLVISKEDQIDFINNLLKNVSTLPREILQHFDKEKTYIFLGFNADDWHLPLIFRSLRLHEEKEMSYYFQDGQLSAATRHFYTDSFDFQFMTDNANEFTNDLVLGYEEWLKRQDEKQSPEATKLVYIDKPQPGIGGKVNILMLTAMPKDTTALELNSEIDIVEEAHVRGSERNLFLFKPMLNTKKERLLDLLLRHKPQIVHFSGHGVGSKGLLFYGSTGNADIVGGNELAMLFKQFSDQITCIVLNACYSEEQAKVISQFIPNVIGTDNAIGDALAIRFTEGFYTAIFAGKNYEQAYNMSMAHIGLQNFPPGGRPVFYKNGEKYIAS